MPYASYDGSKRKTCGGGEPSQKRSKGTLNARTFSGNAGDMTAILDSIIRPCLRNPQTFEEMGVVCDPSATSSTYASEGVKFG